MDQRDYCFVPRVLAVDAGQQVEFLNNDVANHGVSAASFERGATRSACAIPTAAWTAAKSLSSDPARLCNSESSSAKRIGKREPGRNRPDEPSAHPSHSWPPPGVRMAESSFSSGLPELPHLGTFARAAELGSFTAAAAELGVSQAAVSQRIAALERQLKVSLFQRRAGKVHLTQLGSRLYDYARQILRLHEEAREALSGLHQPDSGDLPLAAKRTVV